MAGGDAPDTLEGSAGMHGAVRLQAVAAQLGEELRGGTDPDGLAPYFEALERVARETTAAVMQSMASA